ncbi:aminotransferase class I/II-fold pyridoxal phosphate-dependent enzyme [Nocardia sp. NBC_00565]|uniref:aminotransferase class I/II-fold pyridoxal phosphate-dependent enzyme n=1 Tax=Nocardia sp. NBC_00565 TaxID=2975993 RepID=UPI002E81BA2E|nr:aminotransferase class I/II-fold pyridoxal phosphate-dependent enzyme [Nocardia sp. NBC_00565]WUC00238.1 aminotransferase class I/II-fold pyridoxal phosphate-dependent enzyme [Nocardia sp. NBC_00565]
MTTESIDPRALARALMAKHGQGNGASAATGTATAPTTPDRGASNGRGTDSPTLQTTFRDHPGVLDANEKFAAFDTWTREAGVLNPYYLPHEGISGPVTRFSDRDMLNFSSFGYLDLAAEPRVHAAAIAAIGRYGTSAAAVRMVAGELPLYGELEREIARIYDTEAAIVTASGFLTNAAAVAFLLGKRDIAICDSLIHNSIVSGTEWAGCKRVTFRHNDPESLEAMLSMSRRSFDRALVLIEGVYSMDGDVVRLPEIIEVARKYNCSIMIDEAHSFGVLGERGLGVRELFDLPGDAVDVWMGTLSKALGSVGGYLAANRELVEGFKYSASGLSMYTASPAPSAAAAALEGLAVLHDEPERVAALRHNAQYFYRRAGELGFDTGNGQGTPITPIITGANEPAVRASMELLQRNVMANAIGHPVVPADQARLRFFINCRHTEAQLDHALDTLRQVFDGLTTEEGHHS